MSRVEMAVEKVKHLNENQVKALLEWLELRENRNALRQRLDEEIEVGLEQMKRGETCRTSSRRNPGAQQKETRC